MLEEVKSCEEDEVDGTAELVETWDLAAMLPFEVAFANGVPYEDVE